MSEVSPKRIEAISEAARIPLDPAAVQRVSGAVAATIKRLASADLAIALEVEPMTFVAIQKAGGKR
ncbi:MAG TPA: hypothetical protein VE986_04405 [Hyphomicrobiales bacterium]|nr:hypothetical protein [Hyphomicrobiales bacterium]